MRGFLWLFLAVSMASCDRPGAGHADSGSTMLNFKPNILWLVAEDLSPILSFYGDSTISTPNLERLAEEGVVYDHVYSVSGVCAPSRFGLMTGCHPVALGAHNMRTIWMSERTRATGLEPYEVALPPQVRLLPELLRHRGYFCLNNGKNDYQVKEGPLTWDANSRNAHWTERDKGQPFFAAYNFGVCHEAQVFAPSHRENFRFNRRFPEHPDSLYSNWRPAVEPDEFVFRLPQNHVVPVPPYLPNNEIVKEDLRAAYSNVVEMDKFVGVLLQKLEEDGLLDSTVIVWFGDHGGPMPRQKRSLYDSGLKVPMIVRWPQGLRAGTRETRLVSFVDFAPSMLALAGAAKPEWMQGEVTISADLEIPEHAFVYAAADRFDEYVDRSRAVRDKRYKYIRNDFPERPFYMPLAYREQMATARELTRLRDKDSLDVEEALWMAPVKPAEELYDTWSDPHELQNLAGQTAYEETLIQFRQECARWRQEVEDKGMITEKELRDVFWPQGVQPVSPAPEFRLSDSGWVLLKGETPTGWRIKGSHRWNFYEGPLSDKDTLEAVTHRYGWLGSDTVTLFPRSLH